VPQDRVRKFTEENKQLAAQLHEQMKALQGKPASTTKVSKAKGRPNGSDFSSARGSEERSSTAAHTGRVTQRRHRDYDVEQVSLI
jgi:mortality factor 4-like protein 1